MPAQPVNCFTIGHGNAYFNQLQVGRGIILTTQFFRRFINLGEDLRIYLERGYNAYMVDGGHTTLRRAMVTRVQDKPYLDDAPYTVKSILLLIKTEGLEFRGSLQPLADGLNLWPGGDGELLPVAQFGKHADPKKVQLYELQPGQSIFLTDQRSAVAKLVCVDGELHVEHPGVQECVTFLVARAKAQKKVQALDWALHNLKALQSLKAHQALLSNAIDELARLREMQ